MSGAFVPVATLDQLAPGEVIDVVAGGVAVSYTHLTLPTILLV